MADHGDTTRRSGEDHGSIIGMSESPTEHIDDRRIAAPDGIMHWRILEAVDGVDIRAHLDEQFDHLHPTAHPWDRLLVCGQQQPIDNSFGDELAFACSCLERVISDNQRPSVAIVRHSPAVAPRKPPRAARSARRSRDRPPA